MGKFEVYRSGAKKEYRFRLKADNGQIILSSEGYTTKDSCMKGIESVKTNSSDLNRFNKTKTSSKQFRFSLTAGNNQIIGTSENYQNESGRDNGIDSVRRNAPSAEIKEVDK